MTLVLAAHGSRSAAWQRTVEEIAEAVRSRRPALDVRLGYVDVQQPVAVDLLEPGAVVVPLLLTRGYHVAHDVGGPAAAVGATVSDPVGPDPRLVDALADRLAEAGVPDDVPVVLAAAGSSDPAALADVERQAGYLAQRRATPVRTAYAGGDVALLADVLRETPGPAAVAAYLLAPGHFADLLAAAGAAWTAAPIGAHPAVIEVVLARYDASGQQPVKRGDRGLT